MVTVPCNIWQEEAATSVQSLWTLSGFSWHNCVVEEVAVTEVQKRWMKTWGLPSVAGAFPHISTRGTQAVPSPLLQNTTAESA